MALNPCRKNGRTFIIYAYLGVGLSIGALSHPRSAFAYQIQVFGAGNDSCGTWEVDRAATDVGNAYVDESWVLGYLDDSEGWTGLAVGANVKYDTDANGIFGWLDNYCKANPTTSLLDASEAFVTQTKPFTKDTQ